MRLLLQGLLAPNAKRGGSELLAPRPGRRWAGLFGFGARPQVDPDAFGRPISFLAVDPVVALAFQKDPALAMAEADQAPDEELVASPEDQGGRLYALVQIGLLHQRATAALAWCPAAGRLALFLDAYSIGHLLQVAE